MSKIEGLGQYVCQGKEKTAMAKFKQVPQHYLLSKLMEYWRNMVRNYNGDVRDSDFFDIIASRCPHDRA